MYEDLVVQKLFLKTCWFSCLDYLTKKFDVDLLIASIL